MQYLVIILHDNRTERPRQFLCVGTQFFPFELPNSVDLFESKWYGIDNHVMAKLLRIIVN